MSDDRRREEKERLWNEVLGKNRTYEQKDASEEIELVIDEREKNLKETNTTNETLKDAELAMDELNRILLKQQKELETLSEEMKKSDSIDPSLMDVDRLERDIRKDYGKDFDLDLEEEKPEKKIIDTEKIFDDIYNVISSKIMGQKDAMKQMIIAFRRPYVMGEESGKAKNVILVSGPTGSGRHEAVTQMARSLKEKGVFASDVVYTIDMSRYTSGAQEQIFLQDLYEALQGEGSVICFEHFENGFPSFLRMIDSLATTGSVVLNKRYVLTKGVLVENQTGLVKDSVDSLSAEGKYLIFITSSSASKVQDAFGADFMYHVLDTVTLKPLDDESVVSIIETQARNLESKTKEHLKVDIKIGEDIQKWVKDHFDKTQGADSISQIFYDFYVSLSHAVLEDNLKDVEAKVLIKDDVPTVVFNEKEFVLSRSKNSDEEIAEVNAELDKIVGLDMVKNYIRSLQSHIAMQQKRREQGMKTAEVSKHMIFTGNPGTGKTTIARLISRYMKAIGALSQGQLVEVTRADLVAQYVGQTAPLTMSVIKSAIGGVLFIDEAYSLYRGKDDSFGLEAIDTLVKAMEDNREDLIVILAGYKKEMAGFLESNSGLKSRFPNLIDFPDYTAEELRKIACLQAKGKGYEIEESIYPKMEEFFAEVQSINAMEAGNGRLARNVVEDAILAQSERIVKEENPEMSLLKLEDFDFTVKVKPPKEKDTTTLEDLMKLTQK